MQRLYGLIGYPLTHSFSKKYFTEKFEREGIGNASYELFELEDSSLFPALFSENKELKGLNVTIPHKKTVIPLLGRLDQSAARVGAVNVIKLESDGSLTGYNSDYYGFMQSLKNWAGSSLDGAKALVLGTGGAAAAVKVALEDLEIDFLSVSRTPAAGTVTYEDLKLKPDILLERRLIINTTPLGTFPKAGESPDLPYEAISSNHLLYDLVYNPEETAFMTRGLMRSAKVKNGKEMLVLQAEKAWQIWNQKS